MTFFAGSRQNLFSFTLVRRRLSSPEFHNAFLDTVSVTVLPCPFVITTIWKADGSLCQRENEMFQVILSPGFFVDPAARTIRFRIGSSKDWTWTATRKRKTVARLMLFMVVEGLRKWTNETESIDAMKGNEETQKSVHQTTSIRLFVGRSVTRVRLLTSSQRWVNCFSSHPPSFSVDERSRTLSLRDKYSTVWRVRVRGELKQDTHTLEPDFNGKRGVRLLFESLVSRPNEETSINQGNTHMTLMKGMFYSSLSFLLLASVTVNPCLWQDVVLPHQH